MCIRDRLSKNPIFRWPAKVYVDVIRGTPLLIQIFIIYFALPNIIGERIDPYIAAVAACSLNSGAYIAEIFRAGIQSISLGQMRAGLSLGMTYPQTMRYIVLPQAVKRIIPPLGNEFIAMLKDSSLVSVIGFEAVSYTHLPPTASATKSYPCTAGRPAQDTRTTTDASRSWAGCPKAARPGTCLLYTSRCV